VLVGGATPPTVDALPGPLQPLAALDAHDMTDERWPYDADRLVDAIRKLADKGAAPGRSPFSKSRALVLVAILIGAFLVWRGYATNTSAPTSSTTGAPAQAASTFAGEWKADVAYEWGAKYTEQLKLTVDGNGVSGTASFLGTPRGIVRGAVDGDQITFETRSQEVAGDFGQPRDVVHRYRGRIAGATITFSMQSDGGSSPGPVEFTATRP
jgi:hypothetical protein